MRQEQKKLLKWNKKHCSYFRKCSFLMEKPKLVQAGSYTFDFVSVHTVYLTVLLPLPFYTSY